MGLRLSNASGNLETVRRIKAWAIRRFGHGEEAWMVTETICVAEGQNQRQTIIALIHPAANIAFRIPRPLGEVVAADIEALGEPAARLAAEGCC